MAGTGGKEPPEAVAEDVRAAAEAGLHSYWMPQAMGYEALGLLGWLAREVPGIDLGTAVVHTWTRHPLVLAQEALTAAALAGGRLTLGIGLMHQPVLEGMLGLRFERPIRHLNEYLDALLPLLEDKQASVQGETITCQFQILSAAPAPPVMLAALGPQTLRVAGRRTTGTITWMVGPKTLATHTVPVIQEAADSASRPAPRVVAGFPACVSDDPDGARARAAKVFALYGTLPSYRAMLDREGAAGPEDLALVGDEATVSERLEEIQAAGATEVMAALFGRPEDKDRTRALLGSLARRG